MDTVDPAGGGTRAGAGRLEVDRSLSVPPDELEWRFSRSGGPGGQHANKVSSRVELRFDAAASPTLTETQRARIVGRLGPVVRVVADGERSQLRNRQAALELLRRRLADALRPKRRRVPTRATAGSQERRLEDKRRRAQRKRQRAARGEGDEERPG